MTEKKDRYYVRIIHSATGKIEREMGPMSRAKAERVERGALINMDIENFHTEIVTK